VRQFPLAIPPAFLFNARRGKRIPGLALVTQHHLNPTLWEKRWMGGILPWGGNLSANPSFFQ